MHERLEDRIELVRRYAGSSVRHPNFDRAIPAHALDVDRPAMRCELARVRHEVDDDLPYPLAIRANDERVSGRAPREPELLAVDLRTTHRLDRQSNVAHRERRHAQLDATCIDACEIQQVVDDREQVTLVRFDATQNGDLFAR